MKDWKKEKRAVDFVASVSPKKKYKNIAFIRERMAANQNGVVALNQARMVGSESVPPRNGPTIKPIPKAAPIRPKALALFSGAVESAITACATEIFPPVSPSMARERNRRGMLCSTIPRAKSTYPKDVPRRQNRSTGRRPTWSESCPSKGVTKNCMRGYIAVRRPRIISPWEAETPAM